MLFRIFLYEEKRKEKEKREVPSSESQTAKQDVRYLMQSRSVLPRIRQCQNRTTPQELLLLSFLEEAETCIRCQRSRSFIIHQLANTHHLSNSQFTTYIYNNIIITILRQQYTNTNSQDVNIQQYQSPSHFSNYYQIIAINQLVQIRAICSSQPVSTVIIYYQYILLH